jgi:ferredoxin-nitrite reductase
MNWSACPKGCGIHGIADIGFEGCKAKDRDGNRVDGVHISLGGKITQGPREAHTLLKSIPLNDARYYVLYLLELYAMHRRRGESFETFESRYIQYHYSYQAIAFYARINYRLRRELGMEQGLMLDTEPKTHRVEAYEVFDFGLRLFELLSGEKRYEAVENFEPVLTRPRSIKLDTLHRINPDVPIPLSEAIYRMTHEDHSQRAKVFSEVLAILEERV